MTITKTKKYIAAIAALQILLYHIWIPVFKYGSAIGNLERFLISSTYSGVDIFFFLSAYTLANRPVEDYVGFIKNRALKIMPLFLVALAFGKFIWFLPSIMIMYLVFPPVYRLCKKRPAVSLPLLMIAWGIITYVILGVLKPSQDYGIFLFRIPSIILGAYAGALLETKDEKQSVLIPILGAAMLALGTVLVYKYGYINKVNEPFRGTFYLFGIPTMLGTVLLVDYFAGKIKRINAIEWFGSITLELYFTQMVIGTVVIDRMYKLLGNRLAVNVVVLAIIITIAWMINRICSNMLRHPARS